jgi:hypothetical protein
MAWPAGEAMPGYRQFFICMRTGATSAGGAKQGPSFALKQKSGRARSLFLFLERVRILRPFTYAG